VAGFGDSEEHPPLTFRWSGPIGNVHAPLTTTGGPGRLVLRYGRFTGGPETLQVLLAGRPASTLTATPGRFRVESLPVDIPPGPFRLQLVSASGSNQPALAIDWIRVEGVRWRLPFWVAAPRMIVLGAFAIAVVSGVPAVAAFAVALAVALASAAWAAFDPFALAHAAAKVVVPALVLSAACALVARRIPGARWLTPIFLAGYLLKGAAVFHPSYFYPDVRNHARYVTAFARASGSIVRRGIEAQIQVRTAYPRIVAGRPYVFPYSPLFFVPFSWLPAGRLWIEDGLKHVALASAAAEVLVVFWLARLAFGPASGTAAAALAASLPPLYSRLVLAMHPTVAGHLLDTLAIALAARFVAFPTARRLAGFGASTLAAFLTYIASLFNLSLFAAALAGLERRLAARVLAAAGAAAVLTVALLYLPFTRVFVTEIAPAILRGGGGTSGDSGVAGATPAAALARIPLFYGYAYPLLTAAGLVLARRRARPGAYSVLAAYGLAFAVLVALRAFGGGLFKDLKEVEFVAPLVAVTAGAVLEDLWARGEGSRAAAVLAGAGLVLFGLVRAQGYLVENSSLLDLG
jgi:hypothetical protein